MQWPTALHMIGDRRLIDRLVEFIERGRESEAQSASQASTCENYFLPHGKSPLRMQRASCFRWLPQLRNPALRIRGTSFAYIMLYLTEYSVHALRDEGNT